MISSDQFTRTLLFSGLLALSLSIGASTVMASIFGKSELSGVWKERFLDVKKLNEYTSKGLMIEFSEVTIKGYTLEGAVFNNAVFSNVDWTDVKTLNLSFSNTVFRGNKFTSTSTDNSTFTSATFKNVTFEDSEFDNISFYLSTLTGVKFIRCKFINKTDFASLINSNIEFDHSTFNNVGFAKAHAAISFRNSTLNDVELTSLIFPSTLIFENTKLEDVGMSRSKLAKLVMDKVTGGGRSGFNGGSVADVEVNNSEMKFALNDGNLGKVSFVNSIIIGGFANSNIKTFKITNCKGMKGLGLYQAKIDNLEISNCSVNNIDFVEAILQNVSIEKSPIVNSEFMDMKVKNFTLTDVSFDQKIDFTGAQVEHLIIKNVTKLPGLNLNLTGSNVKF